MASRGGPRLDGELVASIRARRDGASLSAEVDGLVRETSALLLRQPRAGGTAGGGAGADGGGGADDGGADGAAEESPAMADLRRAMKALEQKEADLELAAKIGDALFQENTRLRKENQGSEALRADLEAREEELLAAREEAKSLQRRIDILGANLRDADAANRDLADKLRAAEEDAGASLLHTPTRRQAATTPSSASSPPALRLGSPALRADSHDFAKAESVSRVGSADLADGAVAGLRTQSERSQSDDAEGEATEDLDVALERAERWRKRALAAEQQLKADRTEATETNDGLRATIQKLETSLHRLQEERERTEKLEAESSQASLAHEDLVQDLENLRRECDVLAAENEQLRAEADEFRDVLGARELRQQRAVSDGDRDPAAAEGSHVPSLEDELQGLQPARSASPPAPPPKAPTAAAKSDQDELDLLYFHFHMTAMACMSHLSRAGSADDKIISPATLNTINTMDTREMYNDAIERGIPPHHWIGYIRDCFSRAHLRSLLKEGGNAYRGLAGPPPLRPEGDRSRGSSFASLPEGSQSYLAAPPADVVASSRPLAQTSASHTTRGANANSSMFTRLLNSLAQSPARQGTSQPNFHAGASDTAADVLGAATEDADASASSPAPLHSALADYDVSDVIDEREDVV